MITRDEAITAVEALINEPDLDWPTKPRQAVYDELTIETPWGWVFFHASHPDFFVPDRDAEPGASRPYAVNKSTAETVQLDDSDAAESLSW